MTIDEVREYFKHDRYAVDVTGAHIDEVGDGYSRVSVNVQDKHLGAKDHVMGGVFYTMADFAFAVATNTPDHFTMTLSSNINYLRQPKDDKLIAECRRIKDGRTTCLYETTITDGQGNLLAVATTTGMHVS